jgi:hypothetical protein
MRQHHRLAMNWFEKNNRTSTSWFRLGIICVGIFGVGLAIFLSVKSSPSMSAVGWLPHFITHWADRHGQLCNLPAYAMLAIPFLAVAPGRLHRTCVVFSLAILVAGLEIVQLWIPMRCSDKWDVFWGWSGLLTSWVAVELVEAIWRKMFSSNAGTALTGRKPQGSWPPHFGA